MVSRKFSSSSFGTKRRLTTCIHGGCTYIFCYVYAEYLYFLCRQKVLSVCLCVGVGWSVCVCPTNSESTAFPLAEGFTQYPAWILCVCSQGGPQCECESVQNSHQRTVDSQSPSHTYRTGIASYRTCGYSNPTQSARTARTHQSSWGFWPISNMSPWIKYGTRTQQCIPR